MDSVVAIDLGGTKLASAVVDSTGRILWQTKSAVSRGAVGACLEQIVEVCREAIGWAGSGKRRIYRVGIIVPGIYFADSGNVWAPNLWGHEQVPFRAELERQLKLPVVIDSDRAGYVTGEQWLGAARGLKDVVFLSIGTGIGAGIIAGGQLLRGSGDIAGAVGWFALNPWMQDIYRKVGCWEAEAASPALARRCRAASAEDVIAAACRSDAAAMTAIEQTAKYLGMGIANIVSLLNPEMVVLGGGLMQSADLFLDTVKREMTEWAQPIAAKRVRITITELGENAGLLGAARLAFDRLSIQVNN
jgi:glucokinase